VILGIKLPPFLVFRVENRFFVLRNDWNYETGICDIDMCVCGLSEVAVGGG
jgi:hypothetical protein